MNLRSVNQNLLPVLDALLRERNVSRAADSVGMSQPAASKALAQLRDIFKDRLLVPSAGQLVLTQRGRELAGPVDDICRGLEAIWSTEVFDPLSSQREFVIAGSDYGAMMIISRVSQPLAEQAPRVRMRFIDLVPERMFDKRVRIDFVVAPSYTIPEPVAKSGCLARLFVDDLVTIRAKPGARQSEQPGAARCSTLRMAYANYDPLVPGQISRTARLLKAPGHTQAIVQQFVALPMLVLLTNSVATVPRRLAELVSSLLPIEVIGPAREVSSVEMMLAWNERYEGDADHRWFRDFLKAHVQEPIDATTLA